MSDENDDLDDDVIAEMHEYEPDDYRELLPEGTPESVVIPVTYDMMRAAVLLRRRLPREQYDRLFESIVHLAGEELEVDSTLVEPKLECPDGGA
jgi:hypothetical protein